MTIPLYASDLSFEGYIPTRLALRMEQDGLAQLVRQRGGVRKGKIRRAVMCRRPGDPKATKLRDHMGQAYSYRHGHCCPSRVVNLHYTWSPQKHQFIRKESNAEVPWVP